MAAVRCLFCNRSNPVDAKFCNDCGTTLDSKPCRQCRAANSRVAAACRQCGAAFATEGALQTTAAGWSDVRSDLATLVGTVPAWDDAPLAAHPAVARRVPVTERRVAPQPTADAEDTGSVLSERGLHPMQSELAAASMVSLRQVPGSGKASRKPLGVAALAVGLVGAAGALLVMLNGQPGSFSVGEAAMNGKAADQRPTHELAGPAAQTVLSPASISSRVDQDDSVRTLDQALATAEAALAKPGSSLEDSLDRAAAPSNEHSPASSESRSAVLDKLENQQVVPIAAPESATAGNAAASKASVASRGSSAKSSPVATIPTSCNDAATALGFCQPRPASEADAPKAGTAVARPEPVASAQAPRAARGASDMNVADQASAAGRVCTPAVAALGLCVAGPTATAATPADAASTTIASQIRGEQER